MNIDDLKLEIKKMLEQAEKDFKEPFQEETEYSTIHGRIEALENVLRLIES